MRPPGIRALYAAPLLAAAMLLPGLAGAFDLPQEKAVPGGIKLIRLEGGGPVPYVEADGHRALVVKDGEAWVAVIGIPLAAPLGPRTVRLLEAAGGRDLDVQCGRQALRQPVSEGGARPGQSVGEGSRARVKVERERHRSGAAPLER